MRPVTRRLLFVSGFLVVAVAGPSLLMGLVAGRGAAEATAVVLGVGALLFLLLWLLWRGLRLFLYRVGRKLAFSYFLIGFLPIPMVLALVALSAYLLCGFFMGHVYRDATRELAAEMTQAAQLRLRGGAGATADLAQVAFAAYRGGRRLGGDERFPDAWPGWLEEATPGFVSLPDGTPTLAALATDGERGVVALFTGGIESELTRRTGLWVRLFRPDDPRRASRYRLQLGGREFSLLPLGKESVVGREEHFGERAERGYLARPILWWGEISGPLYGLEDGSTQAEMVTASLNGTLEIVGRELLSTSAEVDTAVWVLLLSASGLLGSIYVVASLLAVVIIFTLSRAVNRLTTATGAVQRGEFATRIPVRRRDQVGELQRSFNEMTANLQMLVAAAAQKESLEKELEIARTLQKRLLPRDLPSTEHLDFAALFEPSAAIGGDYYDILRLAGGRVAVVIADVAGHGLPAGLRMAMLKAALLMLVEDDKPPGEIVRRLDEMIGASGERRFFVTATVAAVDVAASTLELTNAGHPPTYLVRAGEAREIVLPGNPLGALGGSYGRETVPLEPGDVVVWLSDGLIETANGSGEPFGYERVRAALAGPADSAAQVRDRLVAAVARYTGDRPAEDDKTLVAMRYRAASAAELSRPSHE